jgi:Protein of unknown function (DUF3060)
MRTIPIACAALVSLTGCGEDFPTDVSYVPVTAATHDCAKGANVSIETSDGTFAFTNACERMLIKGGNNKLTIEAAKRIEVNGSGNILEIGAVDAVKVNGSGNTINYKKGLTRKSASTVSSGDNNRIIQSN